MGDERPGSFGDEPHRVAVAYCRFLSLTAHLDWRFAQSPVGLGGSGLETVSALCAKRGDLVKEIVEAAARTIEEAILKARIVATVLSDGDEPRLALTPEILEACDRLLKVEGEAEQCLRVLEPALWALCARVRKQIAAAGEKDGAVWWAEVQGCVAAIAGHEAMTPAGLRAKGEVCQERFAFASVMNGLFALQISYFRDFGRLAYRRLYGKEPGSLRYSG